MYSIRALAAMLLAGSASAIIANFDQNNINLADYNSGNYTNFTVVSETYKGGGPNTGSGIKPNTRPNYIVAGGTAAGQYGSARGSLYLNSHSTYGHLNSFYFACYTPASFVPSGNPCNFTMTARCLDKNNNQNTFTLVTNYQAPNSTMQLVDLAGFYQYYAGLGYFVNGGVGARCFSYDFVSVPRQAGTNQLPTGFFLDTFNYTVTTA